MCLATSIFGESDPGSGVGEVGEGELPAAIGVGEGEGGGTVGKSPLGLA